MKKIIATICIVLGISLIGSMIGTGVGSCTAYGQTIADGRSYMEGFVYGTNEDLPVDLMFCTFRSAEIKDNTVRFFLDVSTPDVYSELYDAFVETKIDLLKLFCGGQVKTCRMLAASELDVEYVLTDISTKESKTVVIKAAEIKENMDNIINDIQKVTDEVVEGLDSLSLEEMVDIIKKDYPIEMGNGITAVDARIEKDVLVGYATVDDTDITVADINDLLKEGGDLVKQLLLHSFLRDNGIKVMVKILIKKEMGLSYVFTSTKTGEKCEIVFSPEELRNACAED